MKKPWVIGIILTFMAVSLCLRIIPPYDHVFTGEWIKFISVDAYWQMDRVCLIVYNFTYFVTHLSNPLMGEMTFFHWFLSAVIWAVSLGNPTPQIVDTAAAYLPAVLGVLTIIPVYFLGKVLVDRFVGLMGAGLIAILPGEWLGRSSLGFTDHHVLEVLLSTATVLFLIKAIKGTNRQRVFYGLLAGLCMWLYFLTWAGSIIFVIIFAIALIIHVLSTYFRHRPVYGVLFGIGSVILVVLMLNRYIITVYPMWPTLYTTLEMQRLTFIMAWQNFGLIIFLVPVSLFLLGYRVVKYGEVSTILLFVWSLVMVVAMLEFRRFAYYFAINVALLSGWLTWYIWQRFRADLPKAIAVTAILCGLIVFPNIQIATAKQNYSTPSEAWCETLAWVKENTAEDSLVLSWWDYGYWIQHMGDRRAYITPSQEVVRIPTVARMLLSPPGDIFINVDYLILDYSTITNKLWSISIWASESEENPREFVNKYASWTISSPPIKIYKSAYYNSLMVRLYELSQGEELWQYQLIYTSSQEINGIPEVKVFRQRQVIYGL